MIRKPFYLFVCSIFMVFFTSIISCSEDEIEEGFTETVKVSVRDVGHQLLLINKDSTSIILPVIALESFKYELSFQKQLSFEPGNLVSLIKSSFEKANLPTNYRVEVINCKDKEVAYSYEMKNEGEKSIIPCAGRLLPKNCYLIQIQFTDRKANFGNSVLIYVLLFLVFAFLLYFLLKKKKTAAIEKTLHSKQKIEDNYSSIGSFKFYPEQNKLVKEALVISLSKKECEILAIFLENPNQIIKREELSKRVWEDNGVIVGRSLDTYISKLRKKLKEDTSIQLTNVHGVGYKLEIS